MHIPVLLEDVLQFCAIEPQTLLDATFGRGGHTRALLDKFPDLKVVGLDRDLAAIKFGQSHFPQVEFVHTDFLNFKTDQTFDLILLDLGVSSPQLDEAHRGFSFYHSGPLDMRMDSSQGITAAEVVNTYDEQALKDLFFHLGEVRKPARVVQRILEHRPFTTTTQLSELIEKTEGWRRRGQHPATQYFLALRLEVNQELKQVELAVPALVEKLNDQGRILVITFHSLEDRIVKYIFRNSVLGRPVNKKVVQAKWSEQKINPRARSAKLRVFERRFDHEETTP